DSLICCTLWLDRLFCGGEPLKRLLPTITTPKQFAICKKTRRAEDVQLRRDVILRSGNLFFSCSTR
ncbi:MAG TPA: hypothetical protein VMO00_12840, partial [Methylomirabilota bacterium]|nr:hypothetical protein [Methylomirabilota bacterium]